MWVWSVVSVFVCVPLMGRTTVQSQNCPLWWHICVSCSPFRGGRGSFVCCFFFFFFCKKELKYAIFLLYSPLTRTKPHFSKGVQTEKELCSFLCSHSEFFSKRTWFLFLIHVSSDGASVFFLGCFHVSFGDRNAVQKIGGWAESVRNKDTGDFYEMWPEWTVLEMNTSESRLRLSSLEIKLKEQGWNGLDVSRGEPVNKSDIECWRWSCQAGIQEVRPWEDSWPQLRRTWRYLLYL